MKRAIIVQGLGFGDEGKGATVDFLTRQFSADLVVRSCGGSQAAHNVVLPDGRRHVFSQFGAGTLAGAASYLSEHMIINPPALHKEADHLRLLTSTDPFVKLLLHPRALVSTVYHQQLNRLCELSRGADRHGSCGHGIGETRHYWLKHGQDAVFAADLQDLDLLCGKLELLRQRTLLEAQEFITRVPVEEQWRIGILMEPAREFAKELWQISAPLAFEATMPACETAIFEGAQGVLLDEWRGFHPYTTWSTVTLHHALALLEESGAEEVCTLGILRAYQTRHGAGPLPTWSPELDSHLTDHGNPANTWQGKMRRGWLDLVLLRYAVDVAGGTLDGLVVNCLDDLAETSAKVCTSYRYAAEPELQRLPTSTVSCLASQEQLTRLLAAAEPVYESTTCAALLDTLHSEFASIAITGTGPTSQDKQLGDLRFTTRGGRTNERPTAVGAR